MGNLSKETREKILNVTGGKCFYCGKNIDISSFHVDHYFSKASGASYKNNRVPSCADCNLAKSDKTIEEFRCEIENYLKKDIHVRIVNKYFGIKKKKVKFFFENNNFKPI